MYKLDIILPYIGAKERKQMSRAHVLQLPYRIIEQFEAKKKNIAALSYL